MTYSWVRVTNSQVVSNTPANLGGVILTDNGSGNADVTLYDGQNTSSPPILTVRAAQNTTKTINFQPYLNTERGLYVSVGSNVNELIIQLAIKD